jgi:exopolysaccharide biosynthesis polyprenyl glycosylphosphotransferase
MKALSPSINARWRSADAADAGQRPVRVPRELTIWTRGRAARTGHVAAAYRVCVAVGDALAMVLAVSVLVGVGGAVGLSVAAATAVVCLNAAGGLYRVRRTPSVLEDLRPLVAHILVVAAVAGALLPVFAPRAAWPIRGLAWLWITLLCCLVSLGVRIFGEALIRIHRRRRSKLPFALVVGAGTTTEQVVDVLRSHPELGLAPVGQVTAGLPAEAGSLPILGDASDLPALVEEHRVGTVLILAEEVDHERLDLLLRVCFALGCETLLIQPPPGIGPIAAAKREHLAGLPCVRAEWLLRKPAYRLAKRALDLTVAGALLVLVAPLAAMCAAAVRLEGGPGVLFRQRRVGLEGVEFVMLKFRTLKPTDKREADTRWTVKGDARMGPVGGFLRKTSLDELPQLWNVVRGEMSLVGPRPERPHFVEQFSQTCPGYVLRHRVPAGLTGWAQVNGFRGDTSIELRARLDNYYIDNWSFAADLKILLLTARAMFSRSAG